MSPFLRTGSRNALHDSTKFAQKTMRNPPSVNNPHSSSFNQSYHKSNDRLFGGVKTVNSTSTFANLTAGKATFSKPKNLKTLKPSASSTGGFYAPQHNTLSGTVTTTNQSQKSLKVQQPNILHPNNLNFSEKQILEQIQRQ